MRSKVILILALVVCTTITKAQEILTNESVRSMVKKGLPTSIVVSKIRTSKNSFDVSMDMLIKLKDSGMPDDVLTAMVDMAGDPTKHQNHSDPSNPLSMHDAGIYYLKKTNGKEELVMLEPSIYSQTKTDAALNMFVSGLINVTQKATLDGVHSRTQLKDENPVFYFYFDITKNSLSHSSNWWFATATSPNEFLLAKLQQTTKTRDVQVGTANVVGSSSGVSDKNKVSFQMEKLAPGIYKVYFNQPLTGEFCFMYAGSVPQGMASLNKVYDFGMNIENSSVEQQKVQTKKVY